MPDQPDDCCAGAPCAGDPNGMHTLDCPVYLANVAAWEASRPRPEPKPWPPALQRREPIVEHAIQMSGGGMHIRYDDPEIERIFPLADWIRSNQRFGGKVYRRRVVVVEDWTEVGPWEPAEQPDQLVVHLDNRTARYEPTDPPQPLFTGDEALPPEPGTCAFCGSTTPHGPHEPGTAEQPEGSDRRG
jgi:hypothetical protein